MHNIIESIVRRKRPLIADSIESFTPLSILAAALVGIALLMLLPGIAFNFPGGGRGPAWMNETAYRAAVARFLPLPHEIVAGCMALVGIAIYFFGRRVRNAQSKFGRRRGDAFEPGPDPYDESSRDRLAQKRLKILGTLVNDNHKLLPSDLTVGDLITTVVRTARPSTSIAELRAMTIEFKIRHILVCNDDHELVGVVSDRDLRHALGKLVASDLMAECPTTVTSDTLVNGAITVLLYGHISSLPVVDDGRLVGIITTTDVVMTLQCTMLAVEQMVRDLGARNRPANAIYSEG